MDCLSVIPLTTPKPLLDDIIHHISSVGNVYGLFDLVKYEWNRESYWSIVVSNTQCRWYCFVYCLPSNLILLTVSSYCVFGQIKQLVTSIVSQLDTWTPISLAHILHHIVYLSYPSPGINLRISLQGRDLDSNVLLGWNLYDPFPIDKSMNIVPDILSEQTITLIWACLILEHKVRTSYLFKMKLVFVDTDRVFA